MNVCPVPLCWNPVASPAEPCAGCLAAFGSYLRPTGRQPGAETLAALQAKASRRPAPVPQAARPTRRHRVVAPGSPAALTDEELTEEAVHLVWRCGVGRGDAARRLGVSVPALNAALHRAA